MSHFNKYAFARLASRGSDDENTPSGGSLELWFPYISLDTDRLLSDSLNRLKLGKFDEEDQESFYVFFHEYIHLIQAACFPACQIPVELTYCYIFDANQTAIKRRGKGVREINPIEHSAVFRDTLELLAKTYLHTTIVDNPDGDPIEFSIVNILEGVARILEERFRGASLPTDELYDSLRFVNEAVLGENKLEDRQLLKLAEMSLGAEFPDEMFVRLLLAHKDGGIVAEEGLAAWDNKAAVDQLLRDAKGVLTSSYFAGLREYLCRFYSETPALFAPGMVFVSIYDAIESGELRSMPEPIIRCITNTGSPIISHSSGMMEAFNPFSSEDQSNVLALKSLEAVCKILMDADSSECAFLKNCRVATDGVQTSHPQVDCACVAEPWAKVNNGGLCELTAGWRALGLEGSVKGTDVRDIIGEKLLDSFLLHYTPGKIFGCEVRIWSNDAGNYPHVHIHTIKTGKKERIKTQIDCCVRLDRAEYFIHNRHADRLNNAQCKELDEFMRQKSPKKGENGTNWDVFVREWNKHYPSGRVKEGIAQPEYATLNN